MPDRRVWAPARRPRVPRSLAAALLASASVACGGGNVPLPDLAPYAAGDTAGLAARGEYLVRTVSVCGHCHAADPARDPDGLLSGGLAFRDWRLGTVHAANLTPDRETGLGGWTVAEIVRAIRNGEDREGHTLAPVMPYEWLRGMSDRDALAVAVYLQRQAPVRNRIRNSPSLALRLAKIFLLSPVRDSGGVAPVRGPTAEYGRYLADHVALCVDCHTPRGGLQNSPNRHRLYQGDASPAKGFPANPSNITPDPATGIGRWTEEDFLRAMRTGVTPAGDTLHPFMPWHEYRRMTEDDLRAIYRYLRTLPPADHPVPRKAAPPGGG